jgi:hypothetical protein
MCGKQYHPCVIDVKGIVPEAPYSCPYANDRTEVKADWKEMKEQDFEMNGLCSDCSNCGCSCSDCDDASCFSNSGSGRCEGHHPNMGEKLRSEIAAANAMIEKNKHGKILMQALDIINGDRQDTYGKPEDSFELIAEYWNSYLIRLQKNILKNKGFNPKEYKLVPMIDCKGVAEMMMLFKIARMSGQKPNLDNYLDLVGYAGIAADMVEEDSK